MKPTKTRIIISAVCIVMPASLRGLTAIALGVWDFIMVKKSKKHQKSEPIDPIADLSDETGRQIGNTLRRVVRDQIRSKKPPIVEATYRRLLRSGEDEKNAVELITAVLAADMYDMINEQRDFDEERYAAALRRLPQLPYESDA